MKKPKSAIALFLVVLALLGSLTGCAVRASAEKYEETRTLMNTYFTVTVYSDGKNLADKAIRAAYSRMEEIEHIASIFDPKAEAYRLNQNGYLDNPSLDLVRLVRLSIEYNRLTGGAFDITVQPLLDIWGNQELKLWEKSPGEQQARVDEALKLVDSNKIDITAERISFPVKGMKITLGGIAKGYAADEAIRVISGMGIKHALVAAGGNISSLGTKPNGEPWNIALVNPDNTSQSLATFRFAQKAISTSGNYERYFSPDKKVHHIMNPKTGYSAGECISVTIISENGTQADALSTAVFVMGPEAGMRLAESLDDVECFIVDTDREIHASSGIAKYLIKN